MIQKMERFRNFIKGRIHVIAVKKIFNKEFKEIKNKKDN